MNTSHKEASVLLLNNAVPGGLAPGSVLPERPLRNKPGRSKWLIFAVLTALLVMLWKDVPLERIIPETIIRDVPPVTQLHPVVAAKQAELIAECKQIGLAIRVTDGFRSSAEQEVIYRQGRTSPGPIVTHAKGGDSYHNYGLAIDFALQTKDGRVIWDMAFDGNRNGKSDWMEVVAIAKKLGFTWGGDWKSFPDNPHLQMDFGYSIRELKRGERPPVENP